MSKDELLALKKLAKELLDYKDDQINTALEARELWEIKNG